MESQDICGRPWCVNCPVRGCLLHDELTRTTHRAAAAEAKQGAALIDHIYMDAMGFGMGCSCLQLTFQACNVNEARKLYDALVPLAPLLVSFRFTLRKSRMLTSN